MKTRWMELLIAMTQYEAPRMPWMRDETEVQRLAMTNRAEIGLKRAG
ncbi:hypothetical protein LSUCC0246_08490 [Rhodobacterales bacterium LSUCC0246]|nr:hypothetical protein [Rhodobacterales bacterium LSUCC0374]